MLPSTPTRKPVAVMIPLGTGPVVGSLASRPVSSPIRLDFYDVELRAQHEHLRAAYGIGRGDEVLDIGCGTGLTTREAARASAPGRVLGIDVSERMLERARELTARDRLENVSYELGDAQVSRFDHERFDVAISRFGTMFFSDPAAAFANISSALRPRGRLVWLVWQRREMNEWALAIDAALGGAAKLPPPAADPFSLGDAEATTEMLERGGFEAVRLEDVREPVLYGHDIDAALEFVCGFQDVSAALEDMSHDDAAQAVDRLRETLEAHYGDNHGVAFDSRSWLITARRP
jgi:SAM-dependent methyltransferase